MTIHLPYSRHCIEESDCLSVAQTLRSGTMLTRGPKVKAFEDKLASYTGATYAVCFSNASTALWAACAAIDLGIHDETFVPTNTFIATASCAIARQSMLRLMEIESNNGNVDTNALSEWIAAHPTKRRRLFIPVHFSGRAVDMRHFSQCLRGWGDVIIEDAAHALGSNYPTGEKVGSCAYSDMTIFSFHACKNITCGEGGAVTTNNLELAIRLRRLRNSGIKTGQELGRDKEEPWFYDAYELSCNAHMTEIQAALGLSQFERIDAIGQTKEALLLSYRCTLDPSLDLILADAQVPTHNHLAVALIDFAAFQTTRAKVMQQLASHGIGTQVHYIPLYRHSVIANYNHWLKPEESSWHASEDYYARALSLPLYPHMKRADVDFVVDKLHLALGNKKTG